MNRKLYTSLVLLMSFSLIGIILMQGYWIYSSWKNKEEEFSLAVNRTLREVVNEIQSRELNDYVNTYQMLIESRLILQNFTVKNEESYIHHGYFKGFR